MRKYFGQSAFSHGEIPAVGLLVTNLGTPDAPTPKALRRYLREFLLDRRVIELPRPIWWTILHLFVLTTRPRKSAALYQLVWTEEGSPLLAITRRQATGIAARLSTESQTPIEVAVGMRYGNPSIASALRSLSERGCRKILVLPLYPQYAAATTGSTWDAIAQELSSWRFVPELRFVSTYHDELEYVAALAASVREVWGGDGPAEKLVFSFHGIPQRYFDAGDPYFCFCQKTARLTAEALGLERRRWEVTFQSRFGREEWIKPYTDVTLKAMARSGVRSVDVVCPGFSADCLETLEEIDGQNREFFLHDGGEPFRYVPALNDRPDHLDFLAAFARRQMSGWLSSPENDSTALLREAEASRRRFQTMSERPVSEDAGYGALLFHPRKENSDDQDGS